MIVYNPLSNTDCDSNAFLGLTCCTSDYLIPSLNETSLNWRGGVKVRDKQPSAWVLFFQFTSWPWEGFSTGLFKPRFRAPQYHPTQPQPTRPWRARHVALWIFQWLFWHVRRNLLARSESHPLEQYPAMIWTVDLMTSAVKYFRCSAALRVKVTHRSFKHNFASCRRGIRDLSVLDNHKLNDCVARRVFNCS